jgi:hypothetical protein
MGATANPDIRKAAASPPREFEDEIAVARRIPFSKTQYHCAIRAVAANLFCRLWFFGFCGTEGATLLSSGEGDFDNTFADAFRRLPFHHKFTCVNAVAGHDVVKLI